MAWIRAIPAAAAVLSMSCGIRIAVAAADAGVIHVAADKGNDAWSGALAAPQAGTTDGPLATVQAAVEAARKLGTSAPRRIVLAAGDYFLGGPISLDHRDSGLTLEAAPNSRVTLCGGRRVTGWKPDGDRFWAADVPEVARKKWDFRMLVVNGRLCPRARLPGAGTFTHVTKFDVPWMSTTGGGWKRKPTAAELTTIQYRPDDLGPSLDPANAELTVYHMWDESMVGLAGIDRDSHTLTFANPAGHPPGAFGVQKYVVQNVREGMTSPGQWYLDRTAGKVVYWPLPGEDMHHAEVLAPAMESIIRVNGRPDAPARDITLRGLTLSITHTPLVAGGFGAGAFQGAATLQMAENCRLEGLTITNVAGQGIKAYGARKLRIERCLIHQTGACGATLQATDGLFANNHVHHIGRIYPSAIAVWVGGDRDGGIEVSHNEIHDVPYSAVDAGGNDHRIEHNLIYHAMQELHDGAGIYIGFCKRIVLRGNFIRDIEDTGGYGASAYYLDEQAEDCLVEGNLALRVATPSHNHMARKNTLRNNVFVCDGPARITLPKSSDFCFENNVIHAKGRITFTHAGAITTARHNVLFSAEGGVKMETMKDYQTTGELKIESGDSWLLADPMLTGYEKGKVTFAKDSPALKRGIHPIDVSAAGRKAIPQPEDGSADRE
ncbi:MAG TPA: right-handed parallel beta-helix repeat-containing protein [Phycisphaerae bacterium]|nr:right-handed parallel beta-helix repeat-containing protein [Phycisphaerae bacterium]HRY69917.1 right-handed parallel beta-helix repeat-containing protein [Phycisphaerae bacterium]HSA27126.1 right-handed parallel beta-helix repeat-containing protein [Phycisphaerae bacterium]